MGKTPNGILGPVQGSVGNLTYYKLNGQNIVRKKSKYKDAPTAAQLRTRAGMSVIMNFFTRIKPFLKVGYINQSRGTTSSYFNMALSYNMRHALKIENGNKVLDFSLVKLSSGLARSAKDAKATLTLEGLAFTWLIEPELSWVTQNDQVMMLAYFPQEDTAFYQVSGARRNTGKDLLVLPKSFLGKTMELYISFVGDDRLNASDSVYLGSLN